MKHTTWSSGLSVSADGTGVVAHAGSIAVRLLADRCGLTKELSKATARRSFAPFHDRGQVLVDVAVMLADGGEAIGDINVLGHQGQVLGPVASAPTVWRALDELTPAVLKRIEVARARVRRHVWAQLPDLPASQVADTDLGGVVVLDVDATLVAAHSEKESAAPTFKGGFGYHPLAVWCDNTQEMLAVTMRAGNAGSNTVTDHIDVLSRAIAQVPAAYRKHLLIRADSSHGLLDWLTAQGAKRGRILEYSVRYATNAKVRDAIAKVPKTVWTPANNADGDVREGGDVAELTELLGLSSWPDRMRLIVRPTDQEPTENRHPEAPPGPPSYPPSGFVTTTTLDEPLDANQEPHERPGLAKACLTWAQSHLDTAGDRCQRLLSVQRLELSVHVRRGRPARERDGDTPGRAKHSRSDRGSPDPGRRALTRA